MSVPFNPLAVVTGASDGIGLELAHLLAANGFDLVVSAEDDGLVIAADALRANDVAVEVVRTDLVQAGGVRQLVDRATVTGRPLEVLVITIDADVPGAFVDDSPVEEQLAVVDLTVRSTVHLAKLLVPAMAARGGGHVLFAGMPGPSQPVRDASMAFLVSLSDALREELKDSGVAVTTLMPGLADAEDLEEAAKQAYEAMLAGEGYVGAGVLRNKAPVAAAECSRAAT